MNKTLKALALVSTVALLPLANAADYVIDHKGAHASINFKVNHLGYSWVVGRFDKFEGTFSFDGDGADNLKAEVKIDPASVNSNHAERDKHIRGDDFLDVTKFDTAQFVSTGYQATDATHGVLSGNFTLRGVTKPIEIAVEKVGEGNDPWGFYRAGFVGTTEILMADYGIPMDLGPQSASVKLELHVEGIRQVKR